MLRTRADDNQVKTISYRKADREGHSMTAVAGAIFRIFLQVRLGRRGETKKTAVAKILTELLDNGSEKCLEGIVLTLELGFATQNMVISLLKSGKTACLGILDSQSVRGHPFVARSYLSLTREEESCDEFRLATEANAFVNIALYRRRDFVIDDFPDMRIGCLRAVKTYGRGQSMQKVVALAVQNHGNNKYANILRFLHAVPSPMDERFQHWVTSHHT